MAQIKLLGKTNIQGKTIFETVPAGYSPTDANAISYIAAVEAADGQALETPVKQAIENFIVGCKSDGIWTALKASCIMAGARTLNGALVPLVGTAPTNFNFVSADYNRKTGLIGNGSTKSLSTNRNNNADPQNSKHYAINLTSTTTTGTGTYYVAAGASFLQRSSGITTRLNDTTNRITATHSVGLLATSRSSGSGYIIRNNGTSFNVNIASTTNTNTNARLYSRQDDTLYTNGRISFYSIGESIDLTKLDTRVSALMTALNTAI